MPKPVARIVIFTFLSSEGSVESPHFVSTSSWNFDINSCTSFISSIISVSPSFSAQNEMESSTFLELKMSLLLSSGEWSAASMALLTRFSPSPKPVDMIATPPSLSTVHTSRKSRLMMPCIVMISAIDLAAIESVLSAISKAESTFSSGYISRSRSLLITSRASTCLAISSTPSSAWSILRLPSKRKGMVTMPTVRMSIAFASRAITGAAPVPVPPPMPAVMNTIFVPSLSIL